MAIFEQGAAVVVGISRYQFVPPLLETVTNDAIRIRRLLVNPQQCAYDPTRVELLLNGEATKQTILDAISRLANRCTENSTAIFFFSGHGGTSIKNPSKCYLLPVGSRSDSDEAIAQTSISAKEFSKAWSRVRAKRKLVILDCCHAAGAVVFKNNSVVKLGFQDRMLGKLQAGRGDVVISSCREEEVSFVFPNDENSLFTKHLLAGCEGGVRSQDGLIRVLQLFDYVATHITKDFQGQHPILKCDVQDNFPIAMWKGGQKLPAAQFELATQKHKPATKAAPLPKRTSVILACLALALLVVLVISTSGYWGAFSNNSSKDNRELDSNRSISAGSANQNADSAKRGEVAKPSMLKPKTVHVNYVARDRTRLPHDSPAQRFTDLGEVGADVFETSANEFVNVEIRLEQAAYCYLFALNPTDDPVARIQLCHPESEFQEPAESSGFGYPQQKDLKFPLNDGIGQVAFVLVKSTTPLPSFAEWRDLHLGKNFPWRKTQDGTVWQYEDKSLAPLIKQGSTPRGDPISLGRADSVLQQVIRHLEEKNVDFHLLAFPVLEAF